MSWRELVPEPSRLWIRWAPRRRSGGEFPFIDLIDRRIVWPEPPAPAAPDLERALPQRVDLVYLPPQYAAERAERAAMQRALAAAGMPMLRQIPAGAADGEPGPAPAVTALDLLPLLLGRGEGGAGEPLGLGSQVRPVGKLWVVVPLLPGSASEPSRLATWASGLARLAPAAVVPLTLELSPTDRRRLCEAFGEESFEAVFHGPVLDERAATRALAAAGLPVFPERPEAGSVSRRLARNRRLAAVLAEAGELTLGLGGAEPEGQSLLAAARHLETTPLDLSAVAAEGNLPVVGWLSPDARSLVEECLTQTPPATLELLRRRWLDAGIAS